jgi:hypothetical protein
VSYISVFITHFFNSPVENSGILKKLYLGHGLCVRHILVIANSAWPKTSILNAIKIHGQGKDQRAQKLRVKYGQMMVKGEIVTNPKEQKVIKIIKKLQDEGQSFRQISKHLND